MIRKIIHIDADCFFAAIEMRDNPSLRHHPIAVGGAANRRGVIATCNYEARKFGVHSAMASITAKRLCPNLIIVPGRMAAYREASIHMHEIFSEYSELIEPLSLDEAFLDVTNCPHFNGSATLIAKAIRQKIYQQLNITVSAGIATNKFIAKIASDHNKPNGLTVVPPDQVYSFINQLPIKRINGVGKVTAEKMHNLGIKSFADLQHFNVIELTENFGSFGNRLYELCRGIDQRPVTPSRRRKSLSIEHTYPKDLTTLNECLAQLPELLLKLKDRLKRIDNYYQTAKIFIKIKFSDFSTTTIERSYLSTNLCDFKSLLNEAFERRQISVRLLGLGVRFVNKCNDKHSSQLELFDHPQL